MIKYLLEERGERLDSFLCSHEDINWIRNVERREYKQVIQTTDANMIRSV